MTVHHVDMQKVRVRRNRGHVVGEVGEVGGEDRRRELVRDVQ
jgi:hypothetical protein